MIRPGRPVLVFALAAAFALPLLAEDLTVISKVTAGDHSGRSTQYMTSTKSRSTDGQSDSIIDFPTGRLTFIDHKNKTYWETTLEEMAAYMDKLQKDMQGNPMLASMFGGSDAVSVTKGKGSRKVAGYDCDEYTMKMGESFEFDVCAAKSLEPPPQYYEGRKLSYAAMGPMGKRFSKMFDEMKKVKGYPIALDMDVDMGMVKMNTTSEAVEVKKGAIPASTFDVPAGYAKKPSPFKR
ncbi:MAG TPA: DUF4412 domain-containing protein [Thermoanaerobaculia bacterium]|jgi:hypothetical protein|nr:DUF4412 domain-containing protein [Thermoanaerobaculia bacterium]